MKYFRVILAAMLIYLPAKLSGQYMVVSNHDFIGFQNYPATPYVMEAENSNFFLFTGSYFETLAHPMLGQVYNDFASIIFMKYDPSGKPIWEKHIFGNNYINLVNAKMQEDNLVVFGNCSGNVEIEGNQIPINNGYSLEFLARYDRNGNYLKHTGVWAPGAYYLYSDMTVGQSDGSIYVFGVYSAPLTLDNSTVIGEEWLDSYIYVIKFSRELEFQWAFTTGFTSEGQGYGSYYDLTLTPDAKGDLLLTGNYEGNLRRPVFGKDSLPEFPDAEGIFVYKLSGLGEPMWSTFGSHFEYTYGAGIYETFSLSNGDYILAATCNTGHLMLSDAEVIFDNHNYMENHVVFRMDQKGNIIWSRPVQSMGYRMEGKSGIISEKNKSSEDRKGVRSDQFRTFLYQDAALINEDNVVIAGYTTIDSLVVAGEKLPNDYGSAVFIISINAADGLENWGQSVSSSYTEFSGFDTDPFGNIVLSGNAGSPIQVKGMEPRAYETGGNNVQFLAGVNYDGKPLWLTGAYSQQANYSLISTDVDLLASGTPVAPFYMTTADYVIIEDQSFIYDYNYLDYLFLFQSPNTVSGKIYIQNEQPVYPGQVEAIMESGSGAYPVKNIIQAGDDGSFYFSNLFPGNYTFRVEASKDVYPDAKLTYLGDQITWTDAVFIPVGVTDTIGDVNIVLKEIPPFTVDQGKGEVTGNVSYAGDGTKTLGRPVTKASVVLISKTKKSPMETISAVVETDEFGNYYIQNIPDGSYSMTVDIPGLDMIRTYNVTIVGNQIYSGLDFIVDENNGIDIIWGVGMETMPVRSVQLYPNPGDGIIFLEGDLDEDIFVTVYSVDAKMVITECVDGLSDNVTIDLSELRPGIYFIKLESRSLNSMVKYILQ